MYFPSVIWLFDSKTKLKPSTNAFNQSQYSLYGWKCILWTGWFHAQFYGICQNFMEMAGILFRYGPFHILHYVPYARHYNPRFIYFLPTFWRSKTFFQGGFFQKILSLCMVSIQEWFLLMQKWVMMMLIQCLLLFIYFLKLCLIFVEPSLWKYVGSLFRINWKITVRFKLKFD